MAKLRTPDEQLVDALNDDGVSCKVNGEVAKKDGRTNKVHPAADIFPMMIVDDYERLKQDIATKGQQEPIVSWRGQLIDGRNRLKACLELGIEPSVRQLEDDRDPVSFIVSANLHRRHLTTSQRSMCAARIATLKNGRHKNGAPSIDGASVSVLDAAGLFKVGTASVERAKNVIDKGSADVVNAVNRSEFPVSLAANLVVEVPNKKEQSKLVEKGA